MEDAVIRRWLPLLRGIHHEVSGSVAPQWRDDLYSAGMMALWRALESHDPAKGPLKLHLSAKVRGAMLDERRRFYGRHPDSPRARVSNYQVRIDDESVPLDACLPPVRDASSSVDARAVLAVCREVMTSAEWRALTRFSFCGDLAWVIAADEGVSESRVIQRKQSGIRKARAVVDAA